MWMSLHGLILHSWITGRVLSRAMVMTLCVLASAATIAESPAPSREMPQELRLDLQRAREKQFAPIPPSLQAEVQRAELLGRRLQQAMAADAPPPPAAWTQAAQRASTLLLPICNGMRYRPAVVDATGTSDAGEPAWVYMIAVPNESNLLVAGVHLRLGLAANGEAFDSMELSSHACVTAQRRPDDANAFYFFTQVRSCAPNEHHARMSLESPHPVMVLSSVGLWRLDRGAIQLVTPSPRPCLRDRLSLLLNRWVIHGRNEKDGSYALGMPYIDWSAGISMHTFGSVVIDGQGRIARVQGSNPSEYTIKVRLLDEQGRARYGHGKALSADDVRSLGLDEQPAWLAAYVGPKDPAALATQRGSYLNHIGDPEAALHYLEPLPATIGSMPSQLAFELGYAYNALNRFDRALSLLRNAVEAYPSNHDLSRELAYSYLQVGLRSEAVSWYERSYEQTPQTAALFRTQVAATLADLHRQLGHADACQRWKARSLEAATGLPAANADWRRQVDSMNCSP